MGYFDTQYKNEESAGFWAVSVPLQFISNRAHHVINALNNDEVLREYYPHSLLKSATLQHDVDGYAITKLKDMLTKPRCPHLLHRLLLRSCSPWRNLLRCLSTRRPAGAFLKEVKAIPYAGENEVVVIE